MDKWTFNCEECGVASTDRRVSQSEKNPNRAYYVCSSGCTKPGSDFPAWIGWADEDPSAPKKAKKRKFEGDSSKKGPGGWLSRGEFETWQAKQKQTDEDIFNTILRIEGYLRKLTNES